MEPEEFNKSLEEAVPPATLNQSALALWQDAKGNWEKAHMLVQDLPGSTAAWIHAYLHRKEGDEGNANYWYQRAGKKMPAYALAKEWQEIVQAVL
jgi:hypothetical protein